MDVSISSNSSNTEPKRAPLESLSKEELLQKCKALLSIAQRAKAAKDDAIKESQNLKDEIEKLKAVENESGASAEILDVLTNQKLQLTTELDEAKRKNQLFKSDNEELQIKLGEQEVQIESLKRQLGRSESDCNALEVQLERLDAENRRLAAVANEAEAQLRRGAVERQDALEGLGDELANVKNAAAEALAERDRLKAQLQQQPPNTNFQVLETCQLVVQELRSAQTLLRSDVSELQSAASAMAIELGQALADAQTATEEAARHSSKDILAEMNEAMKTRGEVAAKLADKLAIVERERDSLQTAKQSDLKKIEELEVRCTELQDIANYNESINSKLQEAEGIITSLTQLNNENEAKLACFTKEKEDIDIKLSTLKNEVDQLCIAKETLELKINEQNSEIKNCVIQIENKNKEVQDSKGIITLLETKLTHFDTLQQENEILNSKVKQLEQNINENSKRFLSLEEKETQIIELTKEKVNLLEEIKSLKLLSESNNVEEATQNLQEEKSKLKEEMLKLEKINKVFKKNISELNEKLTNLEDVSKEVQHLKELNDGYIDERDKLNKSIALLENQLLTLESVEKENRTLQDELQTLEQEKKKLSEALTHTKEIKRNDDVNFQNEKDVLLSEVEALKSRIIQLSEDNKNLESKFIDVSQKEKENVSKEMEELRNKNKELIDLTSNLKEKLADLEKEREECDGASVSTVSRSEDSARLKDVEESFEDRYTKLRAVAVKLKQKCHDQAAVLTKLLADRTELQNKLSACCKDRDTLAKNIQSMQAACDASTDEAEAAKQNASQRLKELKRAGEELSEARNKHAEAIEKITTLESQLQQALTNLENVKQENKKSSVLNLEMAAYERSAAEQDKRLAQLKEEVCSLKSELECQKSVSSEHLKQAKHWEENCKNLTAEKSKVVELLSQMKTQLYETRDLLTAESQKYSESVARYETKHSELERVELQLAELSAEKLSSSEASKNFKEQAARQIRILEDQVTSATNTVKSREEELTNLQAEFEGYKARAQAVLLRQQKQQTNKEDPSKEAERESELALLKSTIERLQTSVCDGGEREKSLQAEIAVLTGHNTALQTSARNFANQVSELNTKCEELKNKLMKNEDALRDANRQHRLALDTLSSSYKQQLAEAENRHKSQIANLQAAHEEMKEMSQNAHSPLLEQEHQPVLQQREEGEGSENVDSPKAIVHIDNRREPLPLDRLLSNSSDYHDDVKSEISLDAASLSSVLAAEKRAKHLAALLSEAEADLARLTQQNSVLKEEIRRQQRCMDRQQHTVSNGEYLKNVVLKFITLQGGDERARLVPVLNTILKLSPEETQQLQIVANGNPAVAGPTSPSSTGWGSYLHLWSGTH